MRDAALIVFIFTLIPAIFVQPFIGALLWAWVGMMNPHKMTYGAAYSMPFGEIIALPTLGMLLLTRERRPFPLCATSKLMIVFYLWTCVTSLFALNSFDNVYAAWLQFTKIHVMLFATMMLIRERRHVDQLLGVVVISIGYFGLKGGLFILTTGGGERVYGPPGGFIEGNNELGVALVMILPLLFYLAQTLRTSTWIPFGQGWIKRILWIVMGFSMVAILGTHSRGAFLALGVIGVVLGFKANRPILTTVVFSIALALAMAFMPDSWSARMNTISTHEDHSSQSRLYTWEMIWNLALDRPIVGAGLDFATVEVWQRYSAIQGTLAYSAHSIYFQVLGEHGFVGLLIYLSIGITAWKLAGRLIRQCANQPELEWVTPLVRAIQVSLAGFAIGGAFLGLANWDLPYYLCGLIAVVNAMVQEQLNKTSQAQPPDEVDGRSGMGNARPIVRRPSWLPQAK